MKNTDVKSRFQNGIKKKIDTTMIGALYAIEELFGELWNHGALKRTEEEENWYSKYEELRSRILDNGNNQKRKIDDDFNNHDIKVEQKLYHYQFVVKPRNEEG